MKALDVWLRFAAEDDDVAAAAPNTFATEDGRFRVEWYLTSVGLVKGVGFDTLAEAHAWLTREGFQDFSS
jgi:hypothetical protein